MGKKQSRTEIPAECRPKEVGEEGGGGKYCFSLEWNVACIIVCL